MEGSYGRNTRYPGMGQNDRNVRDFHFFFTYGTAHGIRSHGRDNKLYAWTAVFASQAVADAAAGVNVTAPTLLYSLDVNALNFCRFSLLPLGLHESSPSSSRGSALVAVPNLVESSLVGCLRHWTVAR